MDFYASGFWYSLGYARIDGRIFIFLVSMAWESYFKYLEFDSRLLDVDCLVGTKFVIPLRTLRRLWKS